VTKDEVLATALRTSPALYCLGLAAAVISAVYSARAAWYVWQPLPADATQGYDTEQPGTRRIAPVARPPLVVLAVGAAVLGTLALPAIGGPLDRALGTAGDPSPTGWELAVSAAAAVVASAVAWAWGTRPVPVPYGIRSWLAGWLRLEELARFLLVQPVLALARALAAFDDRVLDHAVDGIGRAARSLGRLARRPQTGQLHSYYAQAAVMLAVLALILVLVR
jgi:hypothetical protein